MRIGIVPVLSSQGGGIYQYSLTMLRTLYELKEYGCEDEYVVFADDIYHPALVSLKENGWRVKQLHPPLQGQQILEVLRRIVGEGPHRDVWRQLRQRWLLKKDQPGPIKSLPDPDVVLFRLDLSRWFNRCGVEMMVYPVPRELSFETGIPYVMAIHDLQHRLQPEFPEVSANGEWECREYQYRNGTRYATLLLTDSEVGKEDILTFYGRYGVTADRVKVLPYLPACYLAVDIQGGELGRVRAAYHLPERYFFYPAQFWPHKNHERIVQALGRLRQDSNLKIPIVFCGSNIGDIRERAFRKMMSLSLQMGIEDQVHYLGYVPDEDMSGLYAGAMGLVMPTFFGPTNIPVLEAWAFGCPVLTSDIRGIREQTGDAAILVDPRSVEAIADGLYRLWTDEDLRRRVADRGRERLSACTPHDYRRRLREILEEAKARVRSEKSLHAKR